MWEVVMKAVIYESFGGVDKLKMTNVANPTLTESEVLIEIEAASVNPADVPRLNALLPAFQALIIFLAFTQFALTRAILWASHLFALTRAEKKPYKAFM